MQEETLWEYAVKVFEVLCITEKNINIISKR